MTASRNFLFAMAAVIIVPFFLVLLPGATPGVPQLSAATSAGSGAISAEDAAAHDGNLATVEGVARQVHVARQATFIDIDGIYPDQPFTAVVFDAARVGDVSNLEGRSVDITGTIRMYKGRPEIIVSSRSQIAAR